MKDYLNDATYYVYVAHDNLMHIRRLNLDKEEKKAAIGAVMADLRLAMKNLEDELRTKK